MRLADRTIWRCGPTARSSVGDGTTTACPTDLQLLADPGQCQAQVFFTVTAADACDSVPVVACLPPSGSLLPVGHTNVFCTASDAGGNINSCSFTVSVYPATTNLPAILGATNRVVQATSPGGAVVAFSVTATNVCQPNVPVNCTPPSGSTFPPGTNPVACVAVDALGATNTATFTVTVLLPPPPLFAGCTLNAPGQIRLHGTGTAGLSYTVQISTNLVDWANHTNLVAGPDGLFEYLEDCEPGVPTRFYRLSWP